jgi:hypothetical protein
VGDTPSRVRVGVLLDREPVEVSEWLADAAAFDAGGADALWIDGQAPEWDVLALVAALAVVTFRARLVVDAGVSPAGRTLDTIGRLSHSRLALVTDEEPPAGVESFRRVPGGFESGEERWVRTSVPQGRAAWRAACVDAAGRGVHGLVVPADSRLLDILRNPEDPGDRDDLQLAQG